MSDARDIMAKLGQFRAALERDQERSIMAALLTPGPAPVTFKLGEAKADLQDDPLVMRMRLSVPVLFAHPRYMVRLDVDEPPELRCGPFTAPSGKQWAVVKDRRTGRRSVVDWPTAPRRAPSIMDVAA